MSTFAASLPCLCSVAAAPGPDYLAPVPSSFRKGRQWGEGNGAPCPDVQHSASQTAHRCSMQPCCAAGHPRTRPHVPDSSKLQKHPHAAWPGLACTAPHPPPPSPAISCRESSFKALFPVGGNQGPERRGSFPDSNS